MENIWDKEMKDLYKELVEEYLDEGYDKQEARNLAKDEVNEMFGVEGRDAYDMAEKVFE